MTDSLNLESRIGKLSCTRAELFSFITDIRNFKQFIPGENLENWQASAEKCSFQIPPLGTSIVRITEQIPYTLVAFSGDALKQDDFSLVVHISENELKLAEVKIIITAQLNPVLKMMATVPIENFLERLISEMEKFKKWNVKFTEN